MTYEWESTWRMSPAPPAFFRPPLLASAGIAVLGRYDGNRIVAGMVANRTATVVGLPIAGLMPLTLRRRPLGPSGLPWREAYLAPAIPTTPVVRTPQ